jgi:hypothetical protein
VDLFKLVLCGDSCIGLDFQAQFARSNALLIHETNIEGVAQEASPSPIVGLNYEITPFLRTENKTTHVLTLSPRSEDQSLCFASPPLGSADLI